MSTLNNNRIGLLAAGALVIAIFAVEGCSSSDDSGQATPTGGTTNTGGTSSTAGSGGKAGGSSTAGSAGKTSVGGTGGTGSGGTDATPEGGDTGAAGAGTCDGPDGCYSCAPTTTPEFANHCVTGGCPATFDNTTITTLDKLGTL